MKDDQLRIALKLRLRRGLSDIDNCAILDEVEVGSGTHRIDIVLVNGSLHGYEIKSDHDSLYRLRSQIQAYNAVFNKLTLVVGYRHIFDAVDLIPEWWGVFVASPRLSGGAKLREVRKPLENPAIDILSLTKLLSRNEALELLEELGAIDGYRSKPRSVLYKRLAEVASLQKVQDRVRYQLRRRIHRQSGEQ